MSQVQQRHVFYLSGYDPRGVVHYYRLYRQHAKRQAEITGMALTVGKLQRGSGQPAAWQVSSGNGGSITHSTIEFLAWDDFIRKEWFKGIFPLLAKYFGYLKEYFCSPLYRQLVREMPNRKVTLLYPLAFALLSLLLALAGGWLVAVLPWPQPWWPAGWLAGLAAGCSIMYLLWRNENHSAFWLLRCFILPGRWVRREIPGSEQRLTEFAQRIAQVLDEGGNDEVMLVAHSAGTALAITVMAQVLELCPADKLAKQRLVLMTLGDCIALMNRQPAASEFTRDLHTVTHSEQLLWVDYTAPPDGVTFQGAAAARSGSATNPVQLSPRFHTLYSAARYKALRFNFFEKHFLYLMSTDAAPEANGYDYYAITAGPLSMHERLLRAGKLNAPRIQP